MTVSSDNSTDRYEGNDATTSFDFNFYILADSDLEVIYTNSSGTDTTLVLDSDYSVTGAGDEAGGSITYPLTGSPLTTGEYITLKRSMTFEQPTDLRAQRNYSPSVIEKALDRIVMFVQQIVERTGRSIRFRPSEDRSGGTKHQYMPTPVTGAVLSYDSDGNLTTTTLGTVSFDVAISGGEAGYVLVVNGTEDGIDVGSGAVSESATASTIPIRDLSGNVKTGVPLVGADALNLDSVTIKGWEIEHGKDTGLKKDISAQDGFPIQVLINDDGTKAYFVGSGNDKVYQYSLSTAYRISTASYDAVSLDLSSQMVAPRGASFGDSGAKLYVGDTSGDIYQYNLTTPYDLSTASYASKTFSAGGTTQIWGVAFKSDGATMILGLDSGVTAIRSYTLSTPWDVSTASYDSKQINNATEDSLSYGIAVKPDGTQVFMLGGTNSTIYRYDLTTAWDLSTGSYSNVSLDLSDLGSDLNGLSADSSDGIRMYLSDRTNDEIYEISTNILLLS